MGNQSCSLATLACNRKADFHQRQCRIMVRSIDKIRVDRRDFTPEMLRFPCIWEQNQEKETKSQKSMKTLSSLLLSSFML